MITLNKDWVISLASLAATLKHWCDCSDSFFEQWWVVCVGHVWPLQHRHWTPAATVWISSIYHSISHPTLDLREICLRRPVLHTPATPGPWLHHTVWPVMRALTHLYVAERTTAGGRAILLPSAQHRATVAPVPPLILTGWRCNCRAGQNTRRSIQVLPAPTLGSGPQTHKLYKLDCPKKRNG